MKARALLLVLFLLALVAPLGRATDESPVDVVFVLDGSGSMQWTDPSSFRQDAVKCFIDLIAEDVGGIAVTQFAGWNETKARGDQVFPLTPLPKAGEALDSVLDLAKKAIDAKVAAFGEATDFNRALGEGIAPVLKDVDKGKKAWVILFTDGEAFEVPESAGTREEYVEAAKARGQDPTSPEVVNAIAMEEFTQKTLPALNKDGIFVTPILLQSSGAEGGESPVLTPLVKEVKSPGKYLRATKESLRSVFLDALQTVPTTFLSSRATKAFDYDARANTAPKAPIEMKFHRFPFATMTRAVIFSESKELEVDVIGPDGKSVRSSPHVKVSGAGARYRVVSLNKYMPPGDYTARITSGADHPVTIEHLWYATIDTRPKIEVAPESHPGSAAEFTVSLLSPDGKVITDPNFLDGLQCDLSYKDARGDVHELTPPRFGGKEARAKDELVLGENAVDGDYVITAKFRALKRDDGTYAYESSAVSAKTSVRSGISVSAAPGEVLEGGKTDVTVALTGRNVPKGLKVTLTDPKGKAHEVELTREGMAKELKGSVALDAAGDWKLDASAEGAVKVDVTTPVVKAKARALVLLDKDGKEVKKIVLPLKWDEASTAKFTGTLAADVKPGESAKLELFSVGGGGGDHLQVDKPPPELAGGRGPVSIEVGQGEGHNVTDNSLQAQASVRVGAATIGGTWPLEITYPDKAAKEFQKLLKLALMIGIPLLLLLLALLAWLYMRPRFEKHSLVAIGQKNEKMAVHNIAQKLGLRGGGGPPEAPGVFNLAALGRRGKTRGKLDGLLKDTPLFVGGKPMPAGYELKNGDRITFEKDGTPYMYLYFEGEPPADLTPYLPEIKPQVADDEIVIEF
ncbi:MAG TPA: vWA domain-containing protein [Planctomycetota bacterium]|nr:vWA domain-containing protein [Planctomycetota bacterium]